MHDDNAGEEDEGESPAATFALILANAQLEKEVEEEEVEEVEEEEVAKTAKKSSKTKTAKRAPSKGRRIATNTFCASPVAAKINAAFDTTWKVVALKNELKKRGLKVSGKKADLLERLLEYDGDSAVVVKAHPGKAANKRSKTHTKNASHNPGSGSKYLRTTTLVAGLRDRDDEPAMLRPRSRRSRR